METEPEKQPEGPVDSVHAPSPQERIRQAVVSLKSTGDSGASWFYYIAILSLVNTAVVHLDINRRFIVGLGITLLVDAVAKVFGQRHPQLAATAMGIAICFSVFVAGMSFLVGWLSRKRYLSIFGLGMFFYVLDGLLYVVVNDYMSAAFHAYALYGMFRGLRAYHQLRRLENAIEEASRDDQADTDFQPEPQFEAT